MPSTRLLQAVRAALVQAARDAAYLTIGLITSSIALAVWITGLTVSLSLVVFIVGLPVVIAAAYAFRWTAELDRRNAAWLLRRPLRATYRGSGEGLRVRLTSTLRDPQTSRDLVWLVLHSALGMAFGIAALVIVGGVLGIATLPAWYWALPDGAEIGIWNADTLLESFALVALAVPAAAVGVGLLRLMALAESGLAVSLLDSDDAVVTTTTATATQTPPARRFDPHVALSLHIAFTALLCLLMAIIWLASGAGYFWPAWVWLGVGGLLGLHVVIARAISAPPVQGRSVRIHAEAVALVVGFLFVVWLLAGAGLPFWPIWPALGFSVPLAVHAIVVFRDRLNPGREREPVERVDELTRTRRGALDVQAAELRRIERDLHDGAQARLVSLSMLVGRAEEELADRPEVAALVRRAREAAGAAIAELRDL
ncbi:MAG: hypothetical protein QOI73_1793, partial [Solirubrobacteraceae bacterium]|nr:hypothetical protein [Solirubrobacteraceae bacterium]